MRPVRTGLSCHFLVQSRSMLKDTIEAILKEVGAKGEAAGFEVDESANLTFILRTGGDPAVIGPVVHVALTENYLALKASKQTQHYFEYNDVLGVRTSRSKQAGGAGFARQ